MTLPSYPITLELRWTLQSGRKEDKVLNDVDDLLSIFSLGFVGVANNRGQPTGAAYNSINTIIMHYD